MMSNGMEYHDLHQMAEFIVQSLHRLPLMAKQPRNAWYLFSKVVNEAHALLDKLDEDEARINHGIISNLEKDFRQVRDEAIKALREMPYKEYLKTEHWFDIRSGTRAEDGGFCRLCGELGHHVHHSTYRNRGFEHPTDTITLCKDCHAKFHDKNSP